MTAGGLCGKNMRWDLADDGTLTIRGKGEMENYVWGSLSQNINTPWRFYRKAIYEIIIYDGVTAIGDFAFSNCSSLMNIKIPDSVKYIGVSAFCDCSSLKEMKVPDNVTSIGNSAFYGCNSLKEIKISDNVTSIGNSAFYGCSSLKEITIPDSVTFIGSSAFYGCENLTEVIIPANVKFVGIWPFGSCENLKKIYYPAGRGFEKYLRQGNNARLISYSGTPPVIKPKPQPQPIFKPAPQPISKYTAPPAQVKPTPQPVIKQQAQPVVENLRWKVEGKTLTVGGVSEIKSYSYEATPWRDSLRDIQKIIIEEGVEKISANAFEECTRLEQLTIPVSVKTIGDGAFTFCYCGDRTINGGRNVIWSLEDGTLMIKKNPAAKNESNFSTGYETWQVVEGNITGVKIERGIVPAKNFFDWVNRMGDGVSVTF